MGHGGKRCEIQRLKYAIPGSTSHPVDGSISSYDRYEYESTGIPLREITLTAVYGGSAENRSFATSTPSGSITFQLNNPNLAEEFKLGQSYYVDFIPAE